MLKRMNKGGRPRLTEEEKKLRMEYLFRKLEAYLMSGLSVNKALREAKVFNSEFYKYMREDRLFREKIARCRQFIGVLANKAIITELFTIFDKQNGNEAKNTEPQPLSKDDIGFLCWFALNSNLCREEWGRCKNVDLFDPEFEIQRVKRLIQDRLSEQAASI